MIRKATRLDIPRIMEIRAGVRENKLRDPSRVTIEDVVTGEGFARDPALVQDYYNRKGLISNQGERKQAFYVLQKYYRGIEAAK